LAEKNSESEETNGDHPNRPSTPVPVNMEKKGRAETKLAPLRKKK